MQFSRKPRHRMHGREIVRPLALGLCTLVGVAALWLWLASLGPQRVVDRPRGQVRQHVARERLSAEGGRLEADYEQLLDAGLGAQEGGPVLREALARQRELMGGTPEAPPEQSARLRRLETAMDTHQGMELNDRIARLELEAAALLAADESEAGRARLLKALSLQRQSNATQAAPWLKNFARESALRQQADTLAVASMAEEMAAAWATAREAVATEAWGTALAAYTQARDIQRRINEDFLRTAQADLAAADRLDREVATLNAGGVAAAVDAAEAAGDAATAAGDMSAAGRHYGEAQARQVEINRLFARSRFVSAARVEELEIKRQSALSTPGWEQVLRYRNSTNERLRRRQVAGTEEDLRSAVQLVTEVFEAFPRSRHLAPGLRNQLVYLERRLPELRELQDALHAEFLPLPGVPSRRLMRREFTQGLYQRTLLSNPSRQLGPDQPVDSVNHHETRECAERVSWILGWPTRLPTWDEYRIAVGDPSSGEVWLRDNARQGRRDAGIAAANEFGYHDLLGNVAEGLEGGEATRGAATVAGGSWLDDEATLRRLPQEEMPRGERARHVGFRLLVAIE